MPWRLFLGHVVHSLYEESAGSKLRAWPAASVGGQGIRLIRMPSRILLISANRCTTPEAVFPLGLAHLHGALRNAGHECFWLDCLADAHGFEEKLKHANPDFVAISLRNIDDVLIRRKEKFFDSLPGLVAAVRRHYTCPVILGGSGFSIFPRQLLELSKADYGIAGEGEASLVALISALERNGDLKDIPGLVFRNEAQIILNPADVGPFNSELLDGDRPEAIANHYLAASRVLNVQTQRGCGFHCCYCTYPLIEGNHHRRRPPEAVAAEFEQVQRLGAKHLFVVDSVFNSSVRHVTEVCEAILRRNLKMSWSCFLRPQHLSGDLMKLMARAGLSHIEFGSDSFCDEVLGAYGKGFNFEDVLHSSELASRERVNYCHFLICGGPGETLETLRDGFENSRQLLDAVIMAVTGMRIYPGTNVFERAMIEGRITPETDLLSPAYYLAPGLTEQSVFALLQEFAGLSPNWIVGDPEPGYLEIIERLRKRGVVGPLWNYMATVQRLWPRKAAL